jgi:hypothetical protein
MQFHDARVVFLWMVGLPSIRCTFVDLPPVPARDDGTGWHAWWRANDREYRDATEPDGQIDGLQGAAMAVDDGCAVDAVTGGKGAAAPSCWLPWFQGAGVTQ